MLPLGEPPVAELELVLEDPGRSRRSHPLAARAAVALRRARRAALAEQELERSETIVEVLSQAIARLSLSHTLETAVERISELSGSDRVGIYLRTGEGLEAAASQGLGGPHAAITERLLELALGPQRTRGYLVASDLRSDARLAGLGRELADCGVGRALVVPLVAGDEVIGALAVYEPEARPHAPGEETLPIALSAQLAVAVQNARLHEDVMRSDADRARLLASERATARRLRVLFEISDAFTRDLSFEATLDAVTRSMVQVFELSAAGIRMPTVGRAGDELRAFYVAEPALEGPVRAILERGDPALLEPFRAQGATVLELPLATPVELLGTLTLLRLDPAQPARRRRTIEAARVVTAQAALVLDNARLYQQQKDFTETMQRSLLPVDPPATGGFEIGHVYTSSARVDVGGDVYDVLVLEDGRLAVCLGDVAGKGIQAAADMAMTKFAFRALARELSRAGRVPHARERRGRRGDRARQVRDHGLRGRRPGSGRDRVRERGPPAAEDRLAGRRRVASSAPRVSRSASSPARRIRRSTRGSSRVRASSSSRTGSPSAGAKASSTARRAWTRSSLQTRASSRRRSWTRSSRTAARSAAASSTTTVPWCACAGP